MNTVTKPMDKWQELPWKKIERAVFKLQKRIYRASQGGDKQTVHKLQRLLIKSWSAKCLAVRRVTQDNRGKYTAGVDGIKSLTPAERLQLAQTLTLNGQTRPTRRVWIPKPGKAEKRPLGIPTMRNRAEQALVKLALEPEWEARFESQTVTGSGQGEAVTMRWRPSSMRLVVKRNMFWMLTSPNASTGSIIKPF